MRLQVNVIIERAGHCSAIRGRFSSADLKGNSQLKPRLNSQLKFVKLLLINTPQHRHSRGLPEVGIGRQEIGGFVAEGLEDVGHEIYDLQFTIYDLSWMRPTGQT